MERCCVREDACIIGVSCFVSVAAACSVATGFMFYFSSASNLPPHAMRLPEAVSIHTTSDGQSVNASQLQADLDAARAEIAELKSARDETERLRNEANDASKKATSEIVKLQAELVIAREKLLEARKSNEAAKAKAAEDMLVGRLRDKNGVAPAKQDRDSTSTSTTAVLAPPSRPPALQLWSSPKCQNLYRGDYESLVGDRKEEGTVFVEESNLFLPSSEAKRTAPGFPHKPMLVKRTLTYEDIVVPVAYNVTEGVKNGTVKAFKTHCIPYFVRTPVRAAKVLLATGYPGKQGSKKDMLYTPIWKVGTTTIGDLVIQGLRHRLFYNYGQVHNIQAAKNCVKQLGLPCHQDTTNMDKSWNLKNMFKFSFVRDPWDRFLAGVQEAKVWSPNMKLNMHLIEDMAQTLLAKYPHRMRMAGLIPFSHMPKDTPKDDPGVCEYKSQSYLLSNTYATGDPLKYDFLGRMEEWEASWHHIADKMGFNVSLIGDVSTRKNPSGAAKLKDEISRMAARNETVVCTVCKVFLQDYVCFGYSLPEVCCRNACKRYGIEFSRSHLDAASCDHNRAQ